MSNVPENDDLSYTEAPPTDSLADIEEVMDLIHKGPAFEEDGTGELVMTTLSAQLANDLAIGLSTPAELCRTYGINNEQWDKLRNNDLFAAMVRDALQLYTGDVNAKERRKKKAEVLLEDTIPRLYHIAHNPEQPGATQVQAIKLMHELTKDDKEAGEGGNRFSVIINLPSADKSLERTPIEISGEVIDSDSSS